jgi:CRP-like cAMP-binding protein
MERKVALPGELIVRQGDIGTELFLIESGEAEVRLAGHAPSAEPVAVLGPGEYFGEVALVTGVERIANVVARTQMSLLSLSKDDYTRYLTHAIEVEQQITRTAVTRTADTMRKVRAGQS